MPSSPSPLHAIAAMAQNRVIGLNNTIPWHLPEDFKWFKEITWGKTLLMGRKTFESIGKPLPGRTTIVLSRQARSLPGAHLLPSLDQLNPLDFNRPIFVCGGSQIYAQTLPCCSDLFLTHLKQQVDGDTFFPTFEDRFEPVATLRDTPLFRIVHWRNQSPLPLPGPA
jgi:dihydrofolate reductase